MLVFWSRSTEGGRDFTFQLRTSPSASGTAGIRHFGVPFVLGNLPMFAPPPPRSVRTSQERIQETKIKNRADAGRHVVGRFLDLDTLIPGNLGFEGWRGGGAWIRHGILLPYFSFYQLPWVPYQPILCKW